MNQTTKKACILVVEDDRAWIEIYTTLLGDFELKFAKTLEEASTAILRSRTWYPEFRVDVCIIDLRLTATNDYHGLTLISLCKDIGLPVVVVSAVLTNYLIYEINRSGVDHIFEKGSFSRTDLILCINEIIRIAPEEVSSTDLAHWENGSSSLQEKQEYLRDIILDCFHKAFNNIGEQQMRRHKHRRKISQRDDDIWRGQTKQLHSQFKEINSKLQKATSIRKIDDIESEITLACQRWKTIFPM